MKKCNFEIKVPTWEELTKAVCVETENVVAYITSATKDKVLMCKKGEDKRVINREDWEAFMNGDIRKCVCFNKTEDETEIIEGIGFENFAAWENPFINLI